VQAKMPKAQKNRASKQGYISPTQLILSGFETPFSRKLNPNNRWVILAHKIPWDTLVGVYQSQLNNSTYGADGINPRVAIGAIIIKHICDLSDRETVLQIQENMYMQYFIGYSSFSDEAPFDPSLFVDLRKRLGIDQINLINEKIMLLSADTEAQQISQSADEELKNKEEQAPVSSDKPQQEDSSEAIGCLTNKGQLIVDATACPQDISYPTDLNLLNDGREKSEELIDLLYNQSVHKEKPRTYREIARKAYLKTAQKKVKTKKEIHKALRRQLGYLGRNIKSIHKLLDVSGTINLKGHQYKYLLVIQTLYDQQAKMFIEQTHSVEHRIVSIHQPHVRPIVRGKTNANVEFGSKIQVSLMNGIAFLEEFSWDAFNEGARLMTTVEEYKRRFGYYPAEVLADKIYCNRNNRLKLKLEGIHLKAKPLGRPRAVEATHVSPGERNPIEGKFGQAKTAYGLNRIKARLSQTSESWIASIILVLNLVKIAGQVPFYFIRDFFTYSARSMRPSRLSYHFDCEAFQNFYILRMGAT
jgi:IS5 family transposase